MAEMALEYIVKILIMIVAAVVIIGLILNFSDDIYSWWGGFTGQQQRPPPEAQVIERASFTAEEVANFVQGCWSVHDGSQEDRTCYFLLGSFPGVDPSSITAALNDGIIDPSKVIFDATSITNTVVISYDNYRSEAGSRAIVINGR